MSHSGVIPQRVTLVLPSTAEFDSRTYRIASSLAARGHAVTVLARLGPGLAEEEWHPAGYRIRRVPASAVDGLPLPNRVRSAIERRRSAASHRAAAHPAAPPGSASATPPGSAAARAHSGAGIRARALRASGAIRRIAAMALVVRSQTRSLLSIDAGADVFHGMAYMGIPVALALARRQPNARVVYDARDIYVDAGNLARLPRPVRAIVGWRERGWARRADRVLTVNVPYAAVMARRWDVPMPAVVMNCSYRYQPPEPRVRRFHRVLGLDPDTRVVLYQGGFSPGRGIEQLMAAVAGMDRTVLVLLGYGPLRAALESRAAMPALAGRVRIMDPVPPTELLDWVAAADVVGMPIQPTTLNHRLTTPNKLLEALAAGVPVVASDLPGMADIVRETGCGLLCDATDPGSIAAAIGQLLAAPEVERRAMAERALAAAHSRYNWESQMEVLLELYGAMTGRPW